jgi:hypothetical protein
VVAQGLGLAKASGQYWQLAVLLSNFMFTRRFFRPWSKIIFLGNQISEKLSQAYVDGD